ncbi:MAG: hypothetical protein HY337_01810 [Gemmatimonadetes bacterium]|nr:hypothetical protein [Gemmatimonadota bacterium]
MTGIRKLWVRVAAPVILLGGIGVVTGARRAREVKQYLETFADSLEHGSGPLDLKVRFVPFYVDGRRLGFVNALHIDRHTTGNVDSVRLSVTPRSAAQASGAVGECHLRLTSFEPGDFKHAITCESESEGNVPFGSVSFDDAASGIPLYLSPVDHACAPWNHDREACSAAREAMSSDVRADLDRVRDEIQRTRDEIRRQVREEVRQNVRVRVR